jgi:polysaccharide export outer membrane protein
LHYFDHSYNIAKLNYLVFIWEGNMVSRKTRRKSNTWGFSSIRGYYLVLLLIVLVTICACSTASDYIIPTTSEPLGADALAKASQEKFDIPPIPSDPGPYRIGPGDILLIRDLDHPELFVGERSIQTLGMNKISETLVMNQFVVQDDRFITLPIIEPARADGRTLTQLQVDLNVAYAQYVKRPNISVTVSNYRSRKVYVLGQVNTPGAYPFDGRISVLDAIGQARGLNERADHMGSYVIRGEQLQPNDLYALLRKGDLTYNNLLTDGDLIHIADSADRKVYVLGEVRAPGVFPMGTEPLRLIDAVSMAGGLNPVTAKNGSILLVRGGYADPKVYKLNLSDVMSLTGAETILESGDRIYATATGLTNWNRIMVQILPFLLGGESAGQMKTDFE